MLPILHLNGYKIANPTIYKSMSNEELTKLFEGYGWHPLIVDGPTDGLDAELAEALDTAYGEIRELQEQVRGGGKRPERPRWPMIVLKSPKGWTGPKEVDGVKVEGTSKAHQVPAMKAKSDPGHLKILEDWLRSYEPAELFDENGGADPGDPRRAARRATCAWARTRTSTAASCARTSSCPTWTSTRSTSPTPGETNGSALMQLGEWYADVFRLNEDERNFRIMCPDEVASNRLGAVFEATDHAWEWPLDPEIDTGPRARRPDHGGALRAQLPGLAAGLRADRPPRRLPLLRGVHPDHRRDGQPVLEVPEDVEGGGPVARARRRASTTC